MKRFQLLTICTIFILLKFTACDIQIEDMTPLQLDPEILKVNAQLDNHVELLASEDEIYKKTTLQYEVDVSALKSAQKSGERVL